MRRLAVDSMKALLARPEAFLAMPPLYRITAGKESIYARDDALAAGFTAYVGVGR